MWKLWSKYLCLSALLICTSACSSLFSRSKTPTNEINQQTDLPFKLEVNDEVNDGDRLHILGSISAQTQWNLQDVIVKLSGLSEGQTLGISYLPLAKDQTGKPALINPNDKYAFSISIPSQNISDYQLELLWGEDAKRYLNQLKQSAPGMLELRDIQVETIQQPCEGLSCHVTFRLNAKLLNATNKNITEVILGAGFIRIPMGQQLDLSKQMPKNEERVSLGKVYLAPGTTRSIKMNFGKIANSELNNEFGQLKPSIRIISFQSE